jgi:hypothetical protein
MHLFYWRLLLCWLFGTSVRKADGLLLLASFCLQLSFFTDEGVQDHFAYLQAFAEPADECRDVEPRPVLPL